MPIDRDYAAALINVHVWSGMYAPNEIARCVLEDCFRPQQIADGDATWVSAEVARTWSVQLEEEKGWPEPTDWDRLNAAFADLNAGGILALHHAGSELSAGMPVVVEEYHARGAEKSGVVGYCYYHWQDIQIAIMGSIFAETWPTLSAMRRRHDLALAFGDIAGDTQKGVEIGRRVAAAVEGAGLRTAWDGTIDRRIVVDMHWQKRHRPYRALGAGIGTDPAPSWDGFTADLARDLAGLRAGDTRIFDSGARYVQVQAGPPATTLEAASNMHLPPGQSLTPDEEQSLRDLGWSAPQGPDPANWRVERPWPMTSTQAAEAARVLTGAIRAMLRAPSPADLEIKAFNAL